MRADETNWHRCILCHDSFWLLKLGKIETLAYVYLSTYCHKPWPISLTIMAKIIGVNVHRLKLAIDKLIARHMIEKLPSAKGAANRFLVIRRTHQSWGHLALPLVPNGTTPLVPNGTTTPSQTALLPTSLKKLRGSDSALLAIFQQSFSKWRFNRQPIGRHFHFTRRMQTQALECMRFLHHSGISTTEGFESFLNSCRDYLTHPRDVLSPEKDQRALSPAKWLNDWPEQVRRAGIYHDEKQHKVTRIEESHP